MNTSKIGPYITQFEKIFLTRLSITNHITYSISAVSKRMIKAVSLIATFYKQFLLFSAISTAFCMRIFWVHGLAAFFTLFWFKIITLVLTYYFINSFKKHEYYYYRNLGIGKTMLWVVTCTFDFILFLFLIILIGYRR